MLGEIIRTTLRLCSAALLIVSIDLESALGADAWPPLPTSGFISGRAATREDVAKGDAEFAAEASGLGIGVPVAIAIPQYAYWTDEKGQKVPVIVLQAEDTPAYRLFGIRNFAGHDIVCTGPEIELLGTTPPN